MSSAEPAPSGRLIVVANRLPITIKRNGGNGFDLSISSGGLVSGLQGLTKSTKFEWFGWPGISVPDNEVDQLKSQLRNEFDAVPVMLDEKLADKHYNGFSSKSACEYHVIISR